MLNVDQPTPKYDQLKKRFMKKVVKEDPIQELQLGLLRLGQDSIFVCSHFLAKGIRHGSLFDGKMYTMEFLDHCTKSHDNEMFRGELDPFELETIFESGLTDRNEEQQEWPVHLLEELANKSIILTPLRNVMVIHAAIPTEDRCLRRFKWLLRSRIFHHIGKVASVYISDFRMTLPEECELSMGYALVSFESEQAASSAAAAAHGFPWPIRGHYNEVAGRFEGLHFHRWKTVLWSHYGEQCQDSPVHAGQKADACPSSSAIPSGNLFPSRAGTSHRRGEGTGQLTAAADDGDPVEGEVGELAMKLQALHRRLDAATSTSISTSIATAAATTSTPALTSTSTLAAVGKGASPKAPVHRDSSSGKQYSPVTRSKIAALLRKSVQEVRQSDETNSPALTPVAPMGKESSTAQPAPGARFHIACLDKLHEALRKLREEICPTKEPRAAVNANLSATATTRRKASFTYGEIDRNIEVCARSEDLFEMVGWYQQKIRLLTQDFLEDSQQQDDFLRFGGGGAKADSADRGDSGASTTSPLHIWEDLQLFLDNIKCSVRASSTTRASIERGTHSPDIVQRILSTLNEIALLLMSAKSSAKSVYIERLQGTVDHQNEVLERSEERIEELRDKVREYGQEIAALESRNEEQRVALAYHRTTGERLVAMERQKSELEREKADSDSKIARMQAYIDHLRETVAGLEATRHRTMQLADTASHNRANLAHTSFLETDSEESVEMEQKRKAGGGSGGGGSLTPHSAGSTSARQAARKQAHENSRGSPEHSLAAADAIVAQLGRLTISDWIETYLYSRDSSTIEKIMETEALMAGTWADLEAALEKLKYANTEVKLCLLAKKGHIERTAKAASKAGAAKKDDQNLCCICQEEVKSILLMPCRHLCVCQVCSEGAPVVHPPRSPRSQAHQRPRMLQSCPMCRATVTECLRVYA